MAGTRVDINTNSCIINTGTRNSAGHAKEIHMIDLIAIFFLPIAIVMVPVFVLAVLMIGMFRLLTWIFG